MNESQMVDGLNILDPRDGQLKVSDNPALVFMHLVDSGNIVMKPRANFIEYIKKMADYCDEVVDVPDEVCDYCGTTNNAHHSAACVGSWDKWDVWYKHQDVGQMKETVSAKTQSDAERYVTGDVDYIISVEPHVPDRDPIKPPCKGQTFQEWYEGRGYKGFMHTAELADVIRWVEEALL